jgi:peptide/nickel transport system substrate-binding protein
MILSTLLLGLQLCAAAVPATPVRRGGELHLALRSDPKTFDALLSADEPSEMVSNLTHERLIRFNRRTQKYEPALAESWKVSELGRKITFQLRKGVQFSDGSAFTANDVAFTIRRVGDPAINSPKASSFRPETGKVTVDIVSPERLTVTFPTIVPSIEAEFAVLPIQSEKNREKALLGPFIPNQYKVGSSIVMVRNPHYWRTENGYRLPYLDTLKIDIQQNADIEAERFRRSELHLMETIDTDLYDRLQKDMPGVAHDAGPSNDIEFLWFNQAPHAPIARHKLAWFQSRNFRRALSAAIRRQDIVRLVYQGRATVAAGLTSPSNKTWYKTGLTPHAYNLDHARKLLQQDGFRWQGETLVDRAGHPVEFSVVTNSGSKVRSRIASLLQQDLAQLGVKINISTFDFPSLVERIGRTLNYEACLLGFINLSEDPMGTMNVLLSSGPQHMWNPGQKQPVSTWELEIDKAMRVQASTADLKKRRAAYERAQQILSDEAPVLFLAHRNTLFAVSPKLRNVEPASDFPRIMWNAGSLAWGDR